MKEIVGTIASIVCIFSMSPQLYQVIKTNSTEDISLSSVLLIILMSLLWIWYGLLIVDWPLIITDVGVTVQELIILIYKIKHLYFKNDLSENE